ncbi:hypothetical protein NN561_017069 [Cricetulus griseus]
MKMENSCCVKPYTYMELCFLSLTRRLKEKSERECWFLTIDTGIPGLTRVPPSAAADPLYCVLLPWWERWPVVTDDEVHTFLNTLKEYGFTFMYYD